MNIGDNIKRFRTLKKLSQKQVALEVDMNQSQYSRIESGKVEPTLTTLSKIATVFEVSVADLVKENQEDLDNINLSLMEKIKQVEELDENERQSILTIIDIALAKKRFKDNLTNLLAS